MSCWTHILANIVVNTHESTENTLDFVMEKLKKSPLITGSEGNASIFVNVLSGRLYDINNYPDCLRCNYNKTLLYAKDGSFTCDAPDDFDCPNGTYSPKIVISIVGDLRDKMKCQTQEEYEEFVSFLENDCKFTIINQLFEIKGW